MPSLFTEPDPFAEYAGPVPDAALSPNPEQAAVVVEREREVPPAPADIVWADDLGDHTDAAQAEYDALRRAEAKELGEPVGRTHTPGVPPAVSEGQALPFAFLWVDPTSGHIVHVKRLGGDTPPRRVGIDTLRTLIDDQFRLVVPDPYTARRLARAAAAAAAGDDPLAPDAARVERQLAVASRLSYSISLVVLTNALARRYWLPAGADTDDLVAWARVFDPRVPTAGRPVAMMAEMLERASDGIDLPLATTAMFYGEMSAMAAARYPGQRARVAAYQGMNRAENGAKVWDTLDLGLLGRNLVTGDVCEVQIISVDSRGFHAVVSQPFKLRTGHRHVVLSRPGDPAYAPMVLSGVNASADGLLRARFDAVTSRGTKGAGACAALLDLAARHERAERPLHVTEEPYLPFTPSRDDDESGRWTRTRTVERVATRWGMPADVAAASAPTGQETR